MAYIADCSFKFTAQHGLLLRPASHTTDWQQGSLRVAFRPKAYYPAERDTGAGDDFEADIRAIAISDIEDTAKNPWHTLDMRDRKRAVAFLERHFRKDMWEAAEGETAEHFGVDDDCARRAA